MEYWATGMECGAHTLQFGVYTHKNSAMGRLEHKLL